MKYCTYVTTYLGDKLPLFYIGSSSIEKVNNGYHGTIVSKKWRKIYQMELSSNPHLFYTEIICTFLTRKEATEYELQLQKSNNVVKSDLFFNESYAAPNGYFGRDVSGEKNPNFGKKKDTSKYKYHNSGAHNTIRAANGTHHMQTPERRKQSSEFLSNLQSNKAKLGLHPTQVKFLCILETKKEFSKNIITRNFPEFKEFY